MGSWFTGSTSWGKDVVSPQVLQVAVAAYALASARKKRKWGGSVRGHVTYDRERAAAAIRLENDYFGPNALYNEEMFRRRFRMRKSLFLKIVDDVTAANDFFKLKRDRAGRLSFSPKQKYVVAMKMLAYGSIADALDDGQRMGESTILKSLKEFVYTIISVYGPEYLRKPNAQELEHILAVNKARGFPGMIGNIDCMHWKWENCPSGWGGMYKGHKGKPTLILEAVATQDLRIWHAFFGLAGSHNDINVLQRSPVFDDLANGNAPPVDFTVNGKPYCMGYYLTDGIYPEWATLVKSISAPVSNKQQVFAKQQESCRKDVERAFGVLQAKWKILHGPTRFWKAKDLNAIMLACVILHNMVIEDERNVQLPTVGRNEWSGRDNPPLHHLVNIPSIDELINAYSIIQDQSTARSLKSDLVEHMWTLYASNSGPFARTTRQ